MRNIWLRTIMAVKIIVDLIMMSQPRQRASQMVY